MFVQSVVSTTPATWSFFVSAMGFVNGCGSLLHDLSRSLEWRTLEDLLRVLLRLLLTIWLELISVILRARQVPTYLSQILVVEIEFFNYNGTGRPPQLARVLRMDPVMTLEGMRPGPLFA
jgi:hypothetical protein